MFLIGYALDERRHAEDGYGGGRGDGRRAPARRAAGEGIKLITSSNRNDNNDTNET